MARRLASTDAQWTLPSPAALDQVPPAELPAVIVELAALQAAAAMRLRARGDQAELLTVEEAAARLSVGVEWVEKRSRTLPFRVSLADGTVRYDADGLRRWLTGRTGAVR
jgi:hypothetical protein